MQITNSKRGSILTPLVAGGIVGASAGLLFAPKPGKALWKDLKRVARSTQKQVSEAVDAGKDLYGDGKTAVMNVIETSNKTIDEGRKMFEKITHKRNNSSLIVPALAAGTIAGAFGALLFAPKPGKELRQDLKRVAEEARDQANIAVDKGRNILEKSKQSISGTLEAGERALADAKRKLRFAA